MTSRRTSRRAPRRASRRTPLLLTALALIVALLAACSGNPRSFSGGGGAGGGDAAAGGGGDKSISIAMVPGWDEDIAATYMWKALLEEKGYTVNVQELEIASTFTGLANDQIDLYLDAWLPSTHAAYWSRYESKLEALTTWSLGKNMLVVPQYVDVSSLDQLRAASAEFGGRIVGIEAGAGLMAATRTKVMPAYGLDNYTLVEGSSPAMLAALDSAIKAKKPIVVTLWQPHWAFSAYQLKELADPKQAFGEPDDMKVLAPKGFSERQPQVAGYLKKFTMKNEQLSSLMLELRKQGKGKELDAAKSWIAANRPVVDAWLAGS